MHLGQKVLFRIIKAEAFIFQKTFQDIFSTLLQQQLLISFRKTKMVGMTIQYNPKVQLVIVYIILIYLLLQTINHNVLQITDILYDVKCTLKYLCIILQLSGKQNTVININSYFFFFFFLRTWEGLLNTWETALSNEK